MRMSRIANLSATFALVAGLALGLGRAPLSGAFLSLTGGTAALAAEELREKEEDAEASLLLEQIQRDQILRLEKEVKSVQEQLDDADWEAVKLCVRLMSLELELQQVKEGFDDEA